MSQFRCLSLSDVMDQTKLLQRTHAYYCAVVNFKVQMAEYHRRLFDWEARFLTPTMEEVETWIQQNLAPLARSALPPVKNTDYNVAFYRLNPGSDFLLNMRISPYVRV